jgi:spermidine/putrescine-binding protein
MKKIIILLSMLVISIGLMTACGKDSGEKVYVYNWGEYIDQDVIDLFEEETGITVVYDEFEQNEEMYPKIKAGAVQYDVVCPSDYMIQKMIEEDLLAEINFDNVPNISNIDPAYLKSAQNFDENNKYSVPYCWGTLGILYNKTMVEEPIDSWSAIFDEKYSGNILMIDSVRDAFGISLSYLGYDLNSTDEAQLEEAKALLQSQYPLVQAYVVDQVRDKMIGGEAALGVIYSGEAIFTKRENPDLEYVVPKEGSNVWIDAWVIPKNCKDKENAEAFINFMCDAEIALKNFEYITYSTPNAAAREMITDEDIKNSDVAFPDQATLDRCLTFRYLGEETEALYIDKWNEVKSDLSE